MIKFTKAFFIYFCILSIIGFKREILFSLIFVLIHEFTHYVVARMLNFSAYDIKILPFGAVLNLKDIDDAEPLEDLIISISGPLINIILSIIFYILYFKFKVEIYYSFYISNLVLGIFNLIPAFPLDGARVLRSILSMKTIYKIANTITLNISIFLGSLMCILYFICFFKGVNSINLGLISLLIIRTSIKEKERVAYIIMGDIIKKRVKFFKNGYLQNRSISIFYKKDLIKALGLIDKNKYNMFLVLDEELRLIGTIYEDEVVEALKIYGNITLEDYINMEN
ncbi:M50 family metallopeptidase [Hathewaya histolytica]|uniref:Zn-dependent protease n=1 Tax=Hathewaya histolytica TaxID=1498 RepID=A0A4U9RHY1_HATHI|nr:M50 family metallopeptidase [Hathewaya histolytica]VTQ90848.1 Zn-dependent protease [Hathewaya histolytica]